jgi:hypothetical protein
MTVSRTVARSTIVVAVSGAELLGAAFQLGADGAGGDES